MNIEDLNRTLVQLLRNEIPHPGGLTVEWIYVDYPRLDATFPRISLTLKTSVLDPHAVGTELYKGEKKALLETTTYDIDIWVKRKNKTKGITPTRRGTALRDYLGDQVVDVLLRKRKALKDTFSIYDVEIKGEATYPYDEETEMFRKTITIDVTHPHTFSP